MKMLFLPFLAWFKFVTPQTIRADLMAGLTGAVIVLPQGIAFATIAGLPPEYGLYTAMITPIIAALFGSSYHLVSGPTTAISIVVFLAISKYAEPGSPEFVNLTLTLTFLAGVYQLAFGLARLGAVVNFVSHTVVVGFTAGAAILIATSQMKHILALDIPKGESFIHTWIYIVSSFDQVNWLVAAVGIATLFVAWAGRKIYRQSPYLLLGMAAGSVLAFFLNAEANDIKLVGEIPGRLPPLSVPEFSMETIKTLAPEAFAIALLGLIEAVSISRAIANKSNQRIQPNQEFIGQGLSNIGGSFFSSYAGSGSFTRTGINYDSGAQTPLSAVFAALFLMIIVLLVSPLTAFLPVAAMGGVILLVAYNLIDFKEIHHILTHSRVETIILFTTFLATLFLDLEFAIYMGVLVSLVVFLARTSMPEIPTLAPDRDDSTGKEMLTDIRQRPLKQCPQLKIIRIDMSVYFGSINHIQDRLQQIIDNEHIYHILIVADGINFIDLSGAEVLAMENERLKKMDGGLYFAHLKPAVYERLARYHFVADLGNDH